MFKKNAIGLYIGSKGLSVVESMNGKVTNYIYSPYPKDAIAPSGVVAPKDSIFDAFLDNEVEIIAFIQKAIRDSKVGDSEIITCIPNRDLIVRFFEIPLIPRKELDATVGFEIKKYIPFKIDELSYDYQVRMKKKITEVLFTGIKNENLDKYSSVIRQLNLKISVIEPGQFTLLRILKIHQKIDVKKAAVVIELNQGEGVISIVDGGFPCFVRDIKLSSEGEQAGVNVENLAFRIINEVRVSIDYYRRQFSRQSVDQLVILSKKESTELLDAFNKELNIAASYENPDNIFGIKEEHSLDLVKAFGASLRTSGKPPEILINLVRKEKAVGSGFMPSMQLDYAAVLEVFDIPKKTVMLSLICALALLVGIFSLGVFKINPVNRDLNSTMKKTNAMLIGSLKGLSITDLKSLRGKNKNKLSTYKKFFKQGFSISEKLEVLPTLLPRGAWIEKLSYKKEAGILSLSCVVYREKSEELSQAPYELIASLKNSHLFSNKVVNITTDSLTSTIRQDYKVIQFNIIIRTTDSQ